MYFDNVDFRITAAMDYFAKELTKFERPYSEEPYREHPKSEEDSGD